MARDPRHSLLLPSLLSAFLFLTGCAHLGYYARSATGGLRLLGQRRPIEKVLADPRTIITRTL